MPRKCPEDYNDSMQSDSDSTNDHEYIQEEENVPATPASPQLSGGVSSAYRMSHVTKSGYEDKVQCNHCVKNWNSLSGSPSTPLKHIRGTH